MCFLQPVDRLILTGILKQKTHRSNGKSEQYSNYDQSEQYLNYGKSDDNMMLVCCSKLNPYLYQGLIQVCSKQSYVELGIYFLR